jgi:hypothetical protein
MPWIGQDQLQLAGVVPMEGGLTGQSFTATAMTALFRFQNSPQILLCKKKIPHHIKISAHI